MLVVTPTDLEGGRRESVALFLLLLPQVPGCCASRSDAQSSRRNFLLLLPGPWLVRTAAQCAIFWSAPDTVPRYKGSCFKPFRATAIASWPSNKNTSPDPRCLAKMKETPPESACEVCQEICKGDKETLLAFVTFSSNQKQKPSKTAYTSGNPLPLRFSTRQWLQFVGSLVLIVLQKFASGPRDIFELSLNKCVRILLLKISQSSQNVGPAHVV